MPASRRRRGGNAVAATLLATLAFAKPEDRQIEIGFQPCDPARAKRPAWCPRWTEPETDLRPPVAYQNMAPAPDAREEDCCAAAAPRCEATYAAARRRLPDGERVASCQRRKIVKDGRRLVELGRRYPLECLLESVPFGAPPKCVSLQFRCCLAHWTRRFGLDRVYETAPERVACVGKTFDVGHARGPRPDKRCADPAAGRPPGSRARCSASAGFHDLPPQIRASDVVFEQRSLIKLAAAFGPAVAVAYEVATLPRGANDAAVVVKAGFKWHNARAGTVSCPLDASGPTPQKLSKRGLRLGSTQVRRLARAAGRPRPREQPR